MFHSPPLKSRGSAVWAAAALTLAMLISSGCGGENSGPSSGGGTPAAPVTLSAVSAASSFHLSRLAASDPAASSKTVAELKKRTDVKEAGLTADGAPYAVFKSGAIWTTATNRPPSSSKSSPDAGRGIGIRNLPKFNIGAVITSLNPAQGYKVYGPVLAPFLTGSGHSLVGGKVLSGTLEDWESVKGVGFLYVDAHGVAVRESGGTTTGAIVTNTVATEPLLALIQDALAKREMVLVSEFQKDADGKLTKTDKVGITSKWLSGRGFLSGATLSFANVCYSSIIGGSVGTFGSGTFLGWKGAVSDSHAYNTAVSLFGQSFKKEGERPTFDEVWAALGRAGLIKDSETGAELVSSSSGDPFGQFLPEIDSGELNAAGNSVTLKGAFSEAKGTAYQNGTKSDALTVTSWSKTEVVLSLKPNTESVTIVCQNRESNRFNIPAYIIREADADSFFVKNRLWITLHNPDQSLASTIVRDGPGTPEGQRGPYRFQAKPGMYIYVSILTDGPVGSNGAIRLIKPDGTKVVVLNSNINAKPFSGSLVAVSGFIKL